VTETAVDNFIAGLNGGGDGAFLALIANSLKRLADHVDPPQEQQSRAGDRYQAQLPQPKRKSPYMDSEVAAAYLGITVKSLYGQVERGHIKPLRGPRRTYRFTVEMLDDYLRN
jgi:hypothetical protein